MVLMAGHDSRSGFAAGNRLTQTRQIQDMPLIYLYILITAAIVVGLSSLFLCPLNPWCRRD
ncbi:hypothetical protein DFQ59_1134 [Thioalbus denitrificans]|uniref:Uncharacterized protein n=1 Tax=Thioalbus denitrificans TaxID=547122 RepID=A0A369BW07_9GAMM|nr:hypothetical protein DFQ59_1134 [Thioalbus denitrificans]